MEIGGEISIGGGAGGIDQLTGDVIAGPGTGSQAATLAAVGTAETVGDASHYPIITTDAKGRVTSATAQAVPAGVSPATTVTGPDAFGAAAVVGASALYAREDHDHGLPANPAPTPATTVTGPDAFGAAAVVGASALYAREDHDHGLSFTTMNGVRITKRVLALSANSATPAVDTDNYDVVHITAQTAAITSFTMTGTPVDGDTLRVSITGTAAVGITWGTSFEASTVALPTTTATTARLDVGFLWNTETSKWRCAAVA